MIRGKLVLKENEAIARAMEELDSMETCTFRGRVLINSHKSVYTEEMDES